MPATSSTASEAVSLTSDQKLALEKLEAFLSSSKQVFVLCGYAGTGKTFLIRHFAERHNLKMGFAAYTGKAVEVLRSSGLEPCFTIHSLIYRPINKCSDEVIERIAAEARKAKTIEERKKKLNMLAELTQNVSFTLRDPENIPLFDLLVVDEYSMLSKEIFDDLRSLYRKILLVGDLGQLPPVDGERLKLEPDANLTEIVRQAEGSPIIQLATKVRQGLPLGNVKAFPGVDYLVNNFDQVLCGMNRTRLEFNMRARQALFGLNCPIDPQPGDRIIILKNHAEQNVFNGQQFTVHSVDTDEDWGLVRYKILTEERSEPLTILPQGFRQYVDKNAMKFILPRDQRKAVLADYAYAITVHKSQGSQWNSVALLDDMYWKRKQDLVYYSRWAYTAITRAVSRFECFRSR